MEQSKDKKHLYLTCNEFISVNHYMNYRVQGKIVMAYKPTTTKKFERDFGNYIKEQIKKQGWVKPPKGKLIILDTVFYFPRTDMDAQNYFKSMCDVMTECGVWEDDNVVMERVNRIYYNSKNPRIEIDIYESDCVGVFTDDKDYESFVKLNCSDCSKKTDGTKGSCSIHKSLLNNKIVEEIILDENGQYKCVKLKKRK